jgi:hypothetical protein
MAHRVGSLRRTDSVAIEGIADIGEALLPVGATRMTRLGHWTGGQAHRAGFEAPAASHLDSEQFRPVSGTCPASCDRLL